MGHETEENLKGGSDSLRTAKPAGSSRAVATGKAAQGSVVQLKEALAGHTYPEQVEMLRPEDSSQSIRQKADEGVEGAGGPLPHLNRIQSAFGRHDLSAIQAHLDGRASQAAAGMGAQAYATGNAVAFREPPSLHTAAHEAAHVVQQSGGVQLKGGVGRTGDAYERHADQVADSVVQGRSAEGLLDRAPGGAGRPPASRWKARMTSTSTRRSTWRRWETTHPPRTTTRRTTRRNTRPPWPVRRPRIP